MGVNCCSEENLNKEYDQTVYYKKGNMKKGTVTLPH